MCSFKIPIAGQHVAILTGFTNTQTVGTVHKLMAHVNGTITQHVPALLKDIGVTNLNSGGWRMRRHVRQQQQQIRDVHLIKFGLHDIFSTFHGYDPIFGARK